MAQHIALRAVTGTESLEHGTSGLTLQVCKGPKFTVWRYRQVIEFISNITKTAIPSEPVYALGRPTVLSAASSSVQEQGRWFDQTFHVLEGVVLRISARKQVRVGGRGGRNAAQESAVMFISPRADAALRRIEFMTIDDPTSNRIPVVIEGRFDVLSLRQAASLGATITPQDITLGTPEKVQSLLMMHVQSPEKSTPPKKVTTKVKTTDGDEVTVATTRRRRATRI